MEKRCDIAETVTYDVDKNKKICILIRKHLRHFYDNIYVPIEFFKINDWNVFQVLADNVDVLFYNGAYVRKGNHKTFSSAFRHYTNLVQKNLNTDSNLYALLSEMPIDPQFKIIVTCNKYRFISPAYIADLYVSCQGDKEQLQTMINMLDILIDRLQAKMILFLDEFAKSFEEYVDTAPLDGTRAHTRSYINELTMMICSFTKKLVNMNIYAVHVLVDRIISEKFPFDIINQYDPEEYNDRPLIIV